MDRIPYEKCALLYEAADVNRELYERTGKRWFEPQEAFLRDREHPFLIFAGGVGAGKSLSGAGYLLPELFHDNGLYWIVATSFTLCREEFNYIINWMNALGVECADGPSMPSEGQWYVKFRNGTVLRTQSALREEAFHGVAVDGMVIAEAGQIGQWFLTNRLIPRAMRSKGGGGWVACTGTFEGADTWYAQAFWDALAGKKEGWRAYKMASWENTVLYPGGEDDIKIRIARQNMTPEEFSQRFGAVPMNPQGLVMQEFQQVRHVTSEAEFNEMLPVQISIDPGRQYAVLAFQVKEGNAVNIIDEVYFTDAGTAEKAIRECVTRPWWKKVTGGVYDVAAPENAETWWKGAIWENLTRERGEKMLGVHLRAQQVPVDAGIERTRTMLHSKVYGVEEEGRTWEFGGQAGVTRIFVNPRCVNTIREFALYRYPPPNKDGQVVDRSPIDAQNHAMKALAYFLVDVFGYASPWARRVVGRRTRLFASVR